MYYILRKWRQIQPAFVNAVTVESNISNISNNNNKSYCFPSTSHRYASNHSGTKVTKPSPTREAPLNYIGNKIRVKDKHVFDESQSILFDLGHYSQVQNDFHNCFGEYEFTGKIGTDIETNKCSWLAVKCMELANPQQKSIMADCYGHNDPQKIARVKQVYEELDMLNIYAKYEEETCNRILMNIQKTSDAVPRGILTEILCQIYDNDYEIK
ncbi:farnesyl pyrophosphate synthase-like isoform X2 [Bactrocera tryoni]|uniref:farnesyl pyrophosphate synthase-like isoform X2 n=1 Tax=Bactrocera tryoni TaxID=59916 RepID=UPI001A971EBA|nr:farnesyl pyrophosphate synthase-like isoform X2 [Bactrocera tryoni]XP_039969286.1 farnesyl pyrophosphate synthase-like isoform X2 [Bactrocera tryoni]